MAVPRDEVEIESVIAVAIYRHSQGDIAAQALGAATPLRRREMSSTRGVSCPASHSSERINPCGSVKASAMRMVGFTLE